MTTELDHKTFDLAAVLAGQEAPEDSVNVYFDKKIGFTIFKLNQAILTATLRGDTDKAETLQKEVDELVEKVKDIRYIIHLRAIDEGVKKGILASVRKDFPVKKNLLGVPEDDLEADQAYTRRLWTAMITRVENPAGEVSLMNEELAQVLQDKAPSTAQQIINQGIADLSEGDGAGFEYAAKEIDFLSIASPEG